MVDVVRTALDSRRVDYLFSTRRPVCESISSLVDNACLHNEPHDSGMISLTRVKLTAAAFQRRQSRAVSNALSCIW